GADLQRRAAEVGPGELPERGRQLRYDARDRHARDIFEVVSGVAAQLAPEHGVFIGGAFPDGRDHPVGHQGAAAVQGELDAGVPDTDGKRSEEHTSELQSRENLVCRLLLEKKKKKTKKKNKRKRNNESTKS